MKETKFRLSALAPFDTINYESNGHDDSLIIKVKLFELYEIYKSIKDDFIHLNIRSFLGEETITNARILSTITSISATKKEQETTINSDNFEIYNNGITICDTLFSVKSGYIELTTPQVINGLQTLLCFSSIYEKIDKNIQDINYQSKKDEMRNISVWVKFVTLHNKNENEELLVFCSNRQNAVSASELRSNSNESKKIAEAFLEKNPKVPFVIKKENTTRTTKNNTFSINLEKIFRLLRLIDIEKTNPELLQFENPELFFNNDELFKKYIGEIADVLKNEKENYATQRLTGLIYISEMEISIGRFFMLKKILIALGIPAHRIASEEGKTGRSEQRKEIVIELLPQIKLYIISKLLYNKKWLGTSEIHGYTSSKELTDTMLEILENCNNENDNIPKLNPGLITEVYENYTEWSRHNDDDEDIDRSIKTYLKEKSQIRAYIKRIPNLKDSLPV